MSEKRKAYCNHCEQWFEPPANVITGVCRRCEKAGHSHWKDECPICNSPKNEPTNKFKKAA